MVAIRLRGISIQSRYAKKLSITGFTGSYVASVIKLT